MRRDVPESGFSVLETAEESSASTVESLQRTGLFSYVERDFYAHTAAVPTIPNDPNYSSQWHLPQIQSPQAWTITTGSPSVVVAVIDSGVDGTHPDLSSKLVPGWNFLNNSANTADDYGHGTAVAGTLAAASNNGVGIAGVTWGSLIMPLVVVDSTDFAAYSDIALAIQYAADHGVRVINISIGGFSPSSTLQNAVNYAWAKGAVVFASAMNNASSTPQYPAACANVVSVSATDNNDNLASFSDFGNWITLSAPGVNIMTTTMGGGYGYWYGTSFSAPIVAGVAALSLSVNPNLTNTALVSLLEQNSDDLGTPGYDTSYGWGRVNAYKAVLAAQASAKPAAPVTISISPASISLAAGQSQTFTATVGGTSDSVSWSLSSAIGSVSGSVYTAPSVISASQTVTVTATVGGVGASALITLTPPVTLPAFTPVRVHSGGGAYVDSLGQSWSADTGYSGGFPYTASNPIANTSDPALFQTCRFGSSFGYQFSVPNGTYTVTLKFAEISRSFAGQRVFNAAINGTSVLANFDIIAQAGGALTAIDKSFPVTATNGVINIQFTSGTADLPLVNAIQIVSGGASPVPTPVPVSAPSLVRVHSGGPAYIDSLGQSWSADTGYTGGYPYSVGGAVSNTPDPALYLSCRYGPSFGYQYAIPNGSYTVTLKFAEISASFPGQRIFNVAINGTAVLVNFDIVAQAVGSRKALDKSFPVTVTNGQIGIQFTSGSVNYPLINAIQIAAAN